MGAEIWTESSNNLHGKPENNMLQQSNIVANAVYSRLLFNKIPTYDAIKYGIKIQQN